MKNVNLYSKLGLNICLQYNANLQPMTLQFDEAEQIYYYKFFFTITYMTQLIYVSTYISPGVHILDAIDHIRTMDYLYFAHFHLPDDCEAKHILWREIDYNT